MRKSVAAIVAKEFDRLVQDLVPLPTNMDAKPVVEFFGGVRKTQEAFGLDSRQTVYHWLRQGKLPELRARQAHELTKGRLKFDKSQYQH